MLTFPCKGRRRYATRFPELRLARRLRRSAPTASAREASWRHVNGRRFARLSSRPAIIVWPGALLSSATLTSTACLVRATVRARLCLSPI